MWKENLWTLPTRTTISLIVIFPVGIYLMFKYKVWTKTKRIVITTGITCFFIVGSLLPPSFSTNTTYWVENVYDCKECYPFWMIRVSNENTGYIISLDSNDNNNQSCKTYFNYTKTNDRIIISFEKNSSLSRTCISQFGGSYVIENKKWTNGNVIIGKPSGISLY